MYCKKCGSKLLENKQFCSNCGMKIINQEEKAGLPWEEDQKQEEKDRIKCMNCRYVGGGLKGRSTWATILAFLILPLFPIITIIYFLVTHKWICPKCKSKLVEEIDEQGRIIKRRNILLIIVMVFVGIAFVGILSSIFLVSLNSAREKAKEATEQQNP